MWLMKTNTKIVSDSTHEIRKSSKDINIEIDAAVKKLTDKKTEVQKNM